MMGPKVTKNDWSAGSAAIEDADYYEARPEGVDVFSWSPAPPGTVNAKSTQVHLMAALAFGKLLVRFKGPGTLDAVIDALIEHRTFVFGPRSGK